MSLQLFLPGPKYLISPFLACLNLSAFSWLHFSRFFPAFACDASDKVMFEASLTSGYDATILSFECQNVG